MEKCSSYHNAYYHGDIEIGQCWGTKKRYMCYCEGDRRKCDYYEDVREKAMEELNEVNKNE